MGYFQVFRQQLHLNLLVDRDHVLHGRRVPRLPWSSPRRRPMLHSVAVLYSWQLEGMLITLFQTRVHADPTSRNTAATRLTRYIEPLSFPSRC